MPLATLACAGLLALAALNAGQADAFLADLHARTPQYADRVIAVAKASLGTPYVDGPLGEGAGAPHDDDPLIDLDHVDCVTFVEQTLALAAAETFADATNLLQEIRYKDGVIDYGTRNHFFIADWIANNRFAVDVTASLGVPTVEETRTIGRRKFFELTKAPEYLDGAVDHPWTLRYAPTLSAAQAEPKLPDLALIVFIGKPAWLFASHCGLYIREGGQGRLYHASSVNGEVIAVPFVDYMRENTKIVGYTAYTIDAAKVPGVK